MLNPFKSAVIIILFSFGLIQATKIILVQDATACFRRVLAGQRITGSCVRRTLPCERVEDCQRECQEEKRFICEGFNYRLDPLGRGQGVCELTDVPLSRLDFRRDVIPDRRYDFYEKDRNSGPDCRPLRFDGFRPYGPSASGHMYGYPPSSSGHMYGYPPSSGGWSNRPRPFPEYGAPIYDHRHTDIGFPSSHYDHGYHYPDDWRRRPSLMFNRRYDTPTYPSNQNVYYNERERDRNYWGHSNQWGSYGGTYGNFGGPESYYGYYGRNQNRYDYDDRRNFVPYRIGQFGGPKDWGQYGGSYGGGYGSGGGLDQRRIYYESPRPSGSGGLVPHIQYVQNDCRFPDYGPPGQINHIDDGYVTYPKGDDCSSRQGTGFRLHKGVVKKFYAVPNIHECERLCYIEQDFNCVSFSFRYSITLSSPTDNCYLSDRSVKDLDFYTDLEPDRDFDIYLLHKTPNCLVPIVEEEESECFLRVRSGQRLAHTIVRDSMNVKSIVDCQLECLASKRFTCRTFSYRFGPPIPRGAIDNCQLSDCPYTELNPRKDLIPEPEYELYERGSYGHGCEHDHFYIPGPHGFKGDHHVTIPNDDVDKLCYVSYGKPVRFTPEAIRASLSVGTDLECKSECTRAREQSKFPCMSFCFRNSARNNEPNCELSDIEQRDLMSDLDFRRDPDSWLFALDNHNPQCSELFEHPSHTKDPFDYRNALDTWRVYTVNGYPCRRGTTCQENREAGFWSCELEGGEVGSWDYCCRPDHQCGYSQGFNYPWCYVGPSRDQWRKCSDRYYPYNHNNQLVTDKHDIHYSPSSSSYLPTGPRPSSSWHAGQPYRPPYSNQPPNSYRPSLDEYEDQFNQQFLDPPKPGGFGAGRHWPVSYLHKEMPPNMTTDMNNLKNNNVFNTIKINTTSRIMNKTNSVDDIPPLFIRFPMPNISAKLTNERRIDKELKFDVIDMLPEEEEEKKNEPKIKMEQFDDLFLISTPKNKNNTRANPKRDLLYPVIRRGFVTRANLTGRLQKKTN